MNADTRVGHQEPAAVAEDLHEHDLADHASCTQALVHVEDGFHERGSGDLSFHEGLRRPSRTSLMAAGGHLRAQRRDEGPCRQAERPRRSGSCSAVPVRVRPRSAGPILAPRRQPAPRARWGHHRRPRRRPPAPAVVGTSVEARRSSAMASGVSVLPAWRPFLQERRRSLPGRRCTRRSRP